MLRRPAKRMSLTAGKQSNAQGVGVYTSCALSSILACGQPCRWPARVRKMLHTTHCHNNKRCMLISTTIWECRVRCPSSRQLHTHLFMRSNRTLSCMDHAQDEIETKDCMKGHDVTEFTAGKQSNTQSVRSCALPREGPHGA